MNKIRSLECIMAVAAIAAVVGCGGEATEVTEGTRGDGSIPIGKVQRVNNATLTFRVWSDGTEFHRGTPDASGTLSLPSLPAGRTLLTCYSDDAQTAPLSITIEFGPRSRSVLQVVLPRKDRASDVEAVEFEPDQPIQVEVGKVFVLKTKLSGRDTSGLKPTVWIDGGVGSIDSQLVFRALEPGTGTINASIFGLSASLPVTVVP